jgi:hypothetical protein
MDVNAIVAVLSLFIGAPLIVFGFIYLNKRQKFQLELMREKRELAELELRKEELRVKALAEENRKLDRIIEDRSK